MPSSVGLRAVRSVRRVDDATPGVVRRRAGRGFTYSAPDGTRITDPDELARIRALAVPPAWTDVWICPDADGHVQATGRDARGRKQYRYHPDWRAAQELAKFGRLADFGQALPSIRRRRDRDLVELTATAPAVAAAAVAVLEATMIRVGNEEYVRQNGHYGLTTLRRHHARRTPDGEVRLTFPGKSGVPHRHTVDDPRVVAVITASRRLRGEHLFQYRDDAGTTRALTSADVNDYLRVAAGADVTAKDFRTWMATLQAAHVLAGLEPPRTRRESVRVTNEVVDGVAARLRNTRAVCKASYIHPAVLQTFADGTLATRWEKVAVPRIRGLTAEERRLLGLLRSLESGRTRFQLAA